MTLLAIAQSVSPFRQLLVGFSGGLDSTVLLHRLMLWREQQPDVQIRAIHIHHGLSANANAWVAHCETLCQTWNIPLIVERVTLKDEGLGTEAQARKARYAAFEHATISVRRFYWRLSEAAARRDYRRWLSAANLPGHTCCVLC